MNIQVQEVDLHRALALVHPGNWDENFLGDQTTQLPNSTVLNARLSRSTSLHICEGIYDFTDIEPAQRSTLGLGECSVQCIPGLRYIHTNTLGRILGSSNNKSRLGIARLGVGLQIPLFGGRGRYVPCLNVLLSSVQIGQVQGGSNYLSRINKIDILGPKNKS